MDLSQTKRMPFSLEAEQSVLGSILISPEILNEVAVKIRPEDFYVDKNREIFDIILTMYDQSQTIDLVTLLDKLVSFGVFEVNEGKQYLIELAEFVPSTANAAKYADIIKEKSYLRQLIDASSDIAENCLAENDSAQNLIDYAGQKIFDISKEKSTKGLSRIAEVLSDTFDKLHEMQNGDQSDYLGIPTGYSQLDEMIGGLNKSDLIIVAARTGIGKTSFAINIAQHVATRKKKSVAIFSLEMSKEQLVARMLSGEAMVNSKKILKADLSADDWDKIIKGAGTLSAAPIKIDDTSGLSVIQMKSKLRREKDLGLVIVDYLQLLTSSKRIENRVLEVAEMTRSLKIMAKELSVPIILISQLSRNTDKREDKKPHLSDLRESGAIEQDADIVIFLHRKEDYLEPDENLNTATCIVAKNRHGDTGNFELMWLPQYTRYVPIDKRHED